MYGNTWETDDKEGATAIDIVSEESNELEVKATKDDENYSNWDKLPDLLLENIFSYLSMREKYWASMTCKNWYRAFYSPKTWYTFVLDDYALTRRKFNYYSGWQYVLDHYRTMQCITNVGQHIRYLVFEPMLNFYNLYEFMNMFSYYVEEGGKNSCSPEGIGKLIRGLKFVFPCTMKQKGSIENVAIFGTGGQILACLKRLMANLRSLEELELIDLMLDDSDARFLLDEVCNQCCLQLKTLILVNPTRDVFPMIHPGVFINLNILVISPQNMGDDLVHLLGYTAVKHLHIKSNMYSPPVEMCLPISPKIWQQCMKNNSELSVHIECEKNVYWQYQAPVKSLIFNSSKEMVRTDIVLNVVENYRNYLETFVHQGIPRFYRSKSFNDRADSSLLLICRQCPYLHTLVIRERVSTMTILLIASTARNLRHFIVRKNAVIIKADWPKSHEWSDDYYDWLKMASKKFELVEKEVSQILRYRWQMLTDKEFKKLHIIPYKNKSYSDYL